jgi:protein TonB
MAEGTGKGTRDALDACKSMVRRRTERNKKYPPRAMRDQIEGIAAARFTINSSGDMAGMSVVKSSVQPVLGGEVPSLLRRVNPLTKFPDALTDSAITLTAPTQFKM